MSFYFSCFDVVYPSLSQSADFILSRFNLFPTTVIPQHKRIKLSMKNTIFSSQSMSQLPNSITEHIVLRGSSPGLEQKAVLVLTCLFPWQSLFGFPAIPTHVAFVVHVSAGRLPVAFMA